MISSAAELDVLVARYRDTTGLVLLATNPACGSCVQGNAKFEAKVHEWNIQRALAITVDSTQRPEVVFVKVLAPLVAHWIKQTKATCIPPVLYLGKNDYLTASSVDDLETNLAGLEANNHRLANQLGGFSTGRLHALLHLTQQQARPWPFLPRLPRSLRQELRP